MSIRLDQRETQELLSTSHTGIVTTLRADGRPISLPVWFVVIDEVIYLRTPPGAAKVERVRKNPTGSFLVERGEAWAELTAWHTEVEIAVVTDPSTTERALAAIAEKYDAFRLPDDQMPASAKAAYAEMTVLALTPVGRPLSWANAKLVSREVP